MGDWDTLPVEDSIETLEEAEMEGQEVDEREARGERVEDLLPQPPPPNETLGSFEAVTVEDVVRWRVREDKPVGEFLGVKVPVTTSDE